MEQISTPDLHQTSTSDNESQYLRHQDEPVGPRPSTIAFLRQLARCYVPVSGAVGPLSAIIAN